MSDRHIEKIFLYLLALSLLLHVAIFAVVVSLPQEKKTVKPEPYMVELRDLPEVKQAPEKQKIVENLQEKARQRKSERSQKAKTEPDRLAPQVGSMKDKPSQEVRRGEIQSPRQPEKGTVPTKEMPRGESLFKPKKQEQPALAKLFPSGKNLSNLEESYRKKYKGMEEGDTRFIDTDDDILGSFAKRFKRAVEERVSALWRGTGDGVVVLYITINRDGIIESVEQLESSGNTRVNEGARKGVLTSSFAGPLPKKWPHEKLHIYYIFVHQEIRF